MRAYPTVPALPPGRPERTGIDEVAWAVWLGCNTPKRLAGEWGLSRFRASHLMAEAARLRVIQRLSRGLYRADPPRGVGDEIGTLPRLADYAAADRRASPAA